MRNKYQIILGYKLQHHEPESILKNNITLMSRLHASNFLLQQSKQKTFIITCGKG